MQGEFEHAIKRDDIEARVRKGVKAILEEVLEGERLSILELAAGSSPLPAKESVTATTESATSYLPQARSSALRFQTTGRENSLRKSSNTTSGLPAT